MSLDSLSPYLSLAVEKVPVVVLGLVLSSRLDSSPVCPGPTLGALCRSAGMSLRCLVPSVRNLQVVSVYLVVNLVCRASLVPCALGLLVFCPLCSFGLRLPCPCGALNFSQFVWSDGYRLDQLVVGCWFRGCASGVICRSLWKEYYLRI